MRRRSFIHITRLCSEVFMAMTSLKLRSWVRMPLVLFLHIRISLFSLVFSDPFNGPIHFKDPCQHIWNLFYVWLIRNWNRQWEGGGVDNRILLIHFSHRPLSTKRRFSAGLLSGCTLTVCLTVVWSGHVIHTRGSDCFVFSYPFLVLWHILAFMKDSIDLPHRKLRRVRWNRSFITFGR